MISSITSKIFYGSLVMAGVVVVVFVLFQGFGDPARLIMGQRADAGTLNNIRKEPYLDQPKWKQFVLYLNDVSPLSIYSKAELTEKKIRYIGIGSETKLVLKFPYLRRSYQTRKEVWSMLTDALPGTIILAFAAMFIATVLGIGLGILAAEADQVQGAADLGRADQAQPADGPILPRRDQGRENRPRPGHLQLRPEEQP